MPQGLRKCLLVQMRQSCMGKNGIEVAGCRPSLGIAALIQLVKNMDTSRTQYPYIITAQQNPNVATTWQAHASTEQLVCECVPRIARIGTATAFQNPPENPKSHIYIYPHEWQSGTIEKERLAFSRPRLGSGSGALGTCLT